MQAAWKLVIILAWYSLALSKISSLFNIIRLSKVDFIKCFCFCLFVFILQIQFYCLEDNAGGLSPIEKAAMDSYTPAIYSVAIRSSRNDEDLHAGISLSARAASYGHEDALCELIYCIQEGYEAPHNIVEVADIATTSSGFLQPSQQPPPPPPNALSRFMEEWFEARCGDPWLKYSEALRLCSKANCRRPEMRLQEFRRCAFCDLDCYCSGPDMDDDFLWQVLR